jgi:hypothetical protein
MRSITDEQWWSFTPTADGTYQVSLGDLARNYSLAVYRPTGSSSSSGSSTNERVITLDVIAGQRITIKVSVGSGGFSSTDPYRLTASRKG